MAWQLMRWCSAAVVALLLCGAASAQGIELEPDADALVGSADTCTNPGKITFKKVRDKTPEWKTIKSEGIDPDSARYEILVEKMEERIRRVCQAVAKDSGHDCVVRAKDIADTRGLNVADLTTDVVKKLESDDEGS